MRRERPPRGRLSFAQAVALFMAALHRDTARALADGLSDRIKGQAMAMLDEALAWDSSTRQARLASEFGAHPEAMDRVGALIVEAPPALRPVLVAQLPPTYRAAFPQHDKKGLEAPPAMRELAARLVREAMRA